MADPFSCCICFERFHRELHPPMTIIPCGHKACQSCIENWRSSHNIFSCPECREIIDNTLLDRNLLDIIENNHFDNPDLQNDSNQINTNKNYQLFSIKDSNKDSDQEILLDRSRCSIYALDNSYSMTREDGKIFQEVDNKLLKIENLSRWDELVYKTMIIAQYNAKVRKIVSYYYLLNPSSHKTIDSIKDWKENIDYLIIDPQVDNIDEKLNILENVLLPDTNIRGNTPLDILTKYLIDSLKDISKKYNIDGLPICYNIITDGEPNYKTLFEKNLKILASTNNIFLTINLCTDEDHIVEYYNDLDIKIGNEMSGMDVLDDFEAEQLEIINAGNTFITYTHDIHLARMAGCNSKEADLLDEELLKPSEAYQIVKQVLKIKNCPHWTDTNNFINHIKQYNKKVYDYRSSKMVNLINISSLEYLISKVKFKLKIKKLYNENKYIIFGSICGLITIAYTYLI